VHPRGPLNRILIIQTAFIGDVILATSLVEYISKTLGAGVQIDFLLRKGNESLLSDNPLVNKIHVWDKKSGKVKNLFKMISAVRNEAYDLVINIQRFFNSGLMTALSGAELKVGFDKNPLRKFFDGVIPHHIPHYSTHGAWHEVQRNAKLFNWAIEEKEMPTTSELKPKLYFNDNEESKIKDVIGDHENYVVIAPASVWFTKALPVEKWRKLVERLVENYHVFAVGGPDDSGLVDEVLNGLENTSNLCGDLSLKESALLMKNSAQVFVNDSGPLHLASSVNAKTTAFFCSTIADYGYFPLADESRVVEVRDRLACRPCGLHGKKECPYQHYDCGHKIDIEEALDFK
jgi:ADP-heptose:LPS heptosyltransferase